MKVKRSMVIMRMVSLAALVAGMSIVIPSFAGEIALKTIVVLEPDAPDAADRPAALAVSRAMRHQVMGMPLHRLASPTTLPTGEAVCSVASYSADCFRSLGRITGADKLITGTVARYRHLYRLSFVIIDAGTGKIENMAEETCGEDSLTGTAGHIARTLVGRKFFFLEPGAVPDWQHPLEVNAFFRSVLESPGKDEWQKPQAVVAKLPVGTGAAIAEIGAGTGYFTLPLARKAGKDGIVYALDIAPDMLAYIEKEAGAQGVTNIRAIHVTTADPPLPKFSVDLAFLCDVYVVLPERRKYLESLKKILKTQGKLVIIDYDRPTGIPSIPLSAMDFGGIGAATRPDTDTALLLLTINQLQNSSVKAGIPFQFRISREEVIGEASQAGYRLEAEHDFLPYQYFLVFSRQ